MVATYEEYLNEVNSQLDNLIEEMRISLRQITEQIGTDAYNALLADYMCPSVEEKLTVMAEAFVDDAFSQFSSEVLAQAAEGGGFKFDFGLAVHDVSSGWLCEGSRASVRACHPAASLGCKYPGVRGSAPAHAAASPPGQCGVISAGSGFSARSSCSGTV